MPNANLNQRLKNKQYAKSQESRMGRQHTEAKQGKGKLAEKTSVSSRWIIALVSLMFSTLLIEPILSWFAGRKGPSASA